MATMIDHETPDDELARRLLAEDRLATQTPHVSAAETARWFESLLAHEQAMERRIRFVALWAWSALFTLGLTFGVGYYLLRGGESTAAVEGGRGMMIVSGTLFAVVLVMALVLTSTWLFRARSLSLTAVERRLGELENLLHRRR
jgi:hypothetical protein